MSCVTLNQPRVFILPQFLHIEKKDGDFPCGPEVKNLPCNAGDEGSIPGQGIKIPPAMEQLSLQATTTDLPWRGGSLVTVRGYTKSFCDLSLPLDTGLAVTMLQVSPSCWYPGPIMTGDIIEPLATYNFSHQKCPNHPLSL